MVAARLSGLVYRDGLGELEVAPVCEAADDASGAEDFGAGVASDAVVVSMGSVVCDGEVRRTLGPR